MLGRLLPFLELHTDYIWNRYSNLWMLLYSKPGWVLDNYSWYLTTTDSAFISYRLDMVYMSRNRTLCAQKITNALRKKKEFQKNIDVEKSLI